jgi:hypothetical protein
VAFTLYQIFSLVPFAIGVAFQILNFKLITMDAPDEIMFYLGQKRRGMKILSGLLAFSLLTLLLISFVFYA